MTRPSIAADASPAPHQPAAAEAVNAAPFTPGPWRVEHDTALVWGACNPDDSSSYGMGVPVASADQFQQKWARDRHEISWDEREANARLIAAAPELFEALTDLRAWLRDGGCADRTASLLKRCDTVLAKARGETA